MQISAQPGESIYKGHRSYDLMLNLQLGIRFSVGSITSKPVPNQLSNSDFQRTVRHLTHLQRRSSAVIHARAATQHFGSKSSVLRPWRGQSTPDF